ncbi:MAG: F0F1 ATP synthase subunit delta [Salana multivorans]|nr:F0F1 ATP synthase subunit delta [Salana multivorans]
MRATSEASMRAAADRFSPVVTAAGTDAGRLGEEIFAVVDALDGSAGMRRALTDPTRAAQDKAALAERALGSAVSPEVVALVAGMARDRWSADRDLADALEQVGTDTYLSAAQAGGTLLDVEDEIFRLGRTLAEQRELRVALGNADLPAENRVGLIGALLPTASPITRALVSRTVGALRRRSVTGQLAAIGELAAARRRRLVATVLAARPLTQAQRTRLGEILSRVYDQPVHLNVGVDPTVVGGLRIQVGSEVLDATILSKLEEARRRIAG